MWLCVSRFHQNLGSQSICEIPLRPDVALGGKKKKEELERLACMKDSNGPNSTTAIKYLSKTNKVFKNATRGTEFPAFDFRCLLYGEACQPLKCVNGSF